MDFVALSDLPPERLRRRPGCSPDRRATWSHPAGLTPIAEYWTASGPVTIVAVFAADDYAPIMEFTLQWAMSSTSRFIPPCPRTRGWPSASRSTRGSLGSPPGPTAGRLVHDAATGTDALRGRP